MDESEELIQDSYSEKKRNVKAASKKSWALNSGFDPSSSSKQENIEVDPKSQVGPKKRGRKRTEDEKYF